MTPNAVSSTANQTPSGSTTDPLSRPPDPASSHGHPPHDPPHAAAAGPAHPHTHGAIDPTIATSERGLWAVKWSLVGLLSTSLLQAGVFWQSGSVALLADLIHNVGDAMTALPLGLAFWAGRWKPTARFAYGYGRLEDIAGVAIVAIIFGSALITAYESIVRIYHPQPLQHLGALAGAAIIGLIGNESVAVFRMKVGREINSAALMADGQHAMADGLVSLAVLVSAIGVGLGYPWADPVVGLVITGVLLKIVWESGQTIFTRLLDGVEPEVLATIRQAVEQGIDQGTAVGDIRARWLGHRLYVEVDIVVPADCSVKAGQAIATQLREHLHDQLPYLDQAIIRLLC
jgi:cation diffusion facilitator family transporter